MENDGYDDKQIQRRSDLGFLKQAEAGMTVKELCRKGVSSTLASAPPGPR